MASEKKSYNQWKTEACKLDPTLTDVMNRIVIDLESFKKTPYVALIAAIVGQKVAYLAAKNIRANIYSMFGVKFDHKDIERKTDNKLLELKISRLNLKIIRDVNKYIMSSNILITDNKDGTLKISFKALTFPTIDELFKVAGIGPWTIETTKLTIDPYIDIFPAKDKFLQKHLQKIFKLDKPPTEAQVKEISKKWAGYRGFITWHLWRDFS